MKHYNRLDARMAYARPEIRDATTNELVAVLEPYMLREAARLVACWNICTGIPTNVLINQDVPAISLHVIDVDANESGLRQKLIELGWTPPPSTTTTQPT